MGRKMDERKKLIDGRMKKWMVRWIDDRMDG